MKITIIGAGNVGANVAYALILRQVCNEIVLIDTDEDKLVARDLELGQSIAVLNLEIDLLCTKEYAPCENSDVVIFCAGLARKEGQSRNELLQINTQIMLECAKKLKQIVPNPLFIILTNPVDLLLNALYESKLFERKKIIAMAGILDNARFKYELAKKFRCSYLDIDTQIMGFHNDDMVLLKSHSRYKNQSIDTLLSDDEFEFIENEVKTGGAKVIKHLKSSAYLAPAVACVRMIEAIRTGEFLVMSVILDGEFGVKGKAFGVLARLDLNGVIEILNVNLSKDEQEKLDESLRKNEYVE